MGNDRIEQNERQRARLERLTGRDAEIARLYATPNLPPAARLKLAADASPGMIEGPPGIFRGPCPFCGSKRCYTVRLDAAGDVQRNCFRGCSRDDLQAVAPLPPAVLFAVVMPPGWRDDGSEHAADLRRWWARPDVAADVLDLAPAKRSRAARGLYAFGAGSSRAGAAEFDASAATLGLDAGRTTRRMVGAAGIIAEVLRLPSRPVERVRKGGPVRRAGRFVVESSRYRLNIPPAAALEADAGPPPAIGPGSNLARGARGELHRTLSAWPEHGRAASHPADLAARAVPPLSPAAARAHVKRLCALGLACAAPRPPTTGRRGQPPKLYMLTAPAAAMLEAGDLDGLARLSMLPPERHNLRGRASADAARKSEAFAARVKVWRAGPAAAAAVADDGPPVAALAADAAALDAAATRPHRDPLERPAPDAAADTLEADALPAAATGSV